MGTPTWYEFKDRNGFIYPTGYLGYARELYGSSDPRVEYVERIYSEDCFYLIDEPHKMVVIDPDTCIDCSLCGTTCPVNAIYRDEEVPEPYEVWIQRNKDLFKSGVLIKKRQELLPTAMTLEEIQMRE